MKDHERRYYLQRIKELELTVKSQAIRNIEAIAKAVQPIIDKPLSERMGKQLTPADLSEATEIYKIIAAFEESYEDVKLYAETTDGAVKPSKLLLWLANNPFAVLMAAKLSAVAGDRNA